MTSYNIKEMVSDNKKAKFLFFKLNELWYETETGFKFPVPINDVQDGIFNAEEKAILLMRYIRKHVAYLEQAQHSENPFDNNSENPFDNNGAS